MRLELCSIKQDDFPEDVIPVAPWCFAENQESLFERNWAFVRPYAGLVDKEKAATAAMMAARYQIHRIGNRLNKEWDRDYPYIFWKTLLGPWVYDFVSFLLDRYLRLKAVIQGNHLDSLVIEWQQSGFVLGFEDTASFTNAYGRPELNAAICAVLLHTWRPEGIDLANVENPLIGEKKGARQELQRHPLRDRLLQYLPCSPGYGVQKWDAFFLSMVVIVRYAFRPFFFHVKDCSPSDSESFSDSVFPFSINLIVDLCLPVSLQNEQNLCRGGAVGVQLLPRIVSNQIHCDEFLMYRIALARSNGVWVAGRQHGAFYGTAKFMSLVSEVEYGLDRYFSWGWKKINGDPVRAFPAPCRLLNHKRPVCLGREAQQTIFVSAPILLSQIRIDASPDAEVAFRIRSERSVFLRRLLEAKFSDLYYRPFFSEGSFLEDESWCRRQFASIPMIMGGNFHEKMLRARLLIFDSPATSFSLALAWNVPTIAFWNPDDWPNCENAQALFDQLETAGIVFTGAKAAADQIISVTENLEEWWHSEPIQAARTAWVEQYAAPSKNFYRDWISAIWSK